MVRANGLALSLGALCVLLFSAATSAQENSGIAGVARDTSGGVLPGVTVEAASPALIEKVRTVVTDGEGRYNIVDLRPGSYTGTFSLGGFSTVKREGVEVSAGFNAAVEAMVLQTSGISAEVNADGPVMNVIPKEGGNTFKTILNGLFTDYHLESNNLTDALRARGLQTVNKTLKIFDEAASLGGPIKKDRLWFFGAARTWGSARQFAGVYWNKTQNEALTPPGAERTVVRLTPWVDRPLDRNIGRVEWYDSFVTRLTWQASTKNKFNYMIDHQHACNCNATSSAFTQEGTTGSYRFEPNVFQ